jgi:hypothetical protein
MLRHRIVLRSLLAVPLLLLLNPFLATQQVSVNPFTSSADNAVVSNFGKLRLSFEPNAGQTLPDVRFIVHAPGGTLFFTQSEIVFALGGQTSATGTDPESDTQPSAVKLTAPPPPILPQVVRLRFVDANPASAITGGEPLPGRVNYFLGNDPEKWHSDLPTDGAVTYTGLYPGIDLRYDGMGGRLKGTYTVAPGTDPGQIRWRYEGAPDVRIDVTGNLQIMMVDSDGCVTSILTEQAPLAWQKIDGQRTKVDAGYIVTYDGKGTYDNRYVLMLDTTLTYLTYLGDSGYEDYSGIRIDGSGNAYVTGSTSSTHESLSMLGMTENPRKERET